MNVLNEVPRIAWNAKTDRRALKIADDFLGHRDIIISTDIESSKDRPKYLKAYLDQSHFPESASQPHLKIWWFTNSDFSIIFTESESSEIRCLYQRERGRSDKLKIIYYGNSGERTLTKSGTIKTHPITVLPSVLSSVKSIQRNRN